MNESKEKSITYIIKEAHQLIREAIVNESLDLNTEDYSDSIMEQSEWRGRNPGVGAGEGIENVLKGIQKAYEMIRDSETRRKLANSITKLGNFMTITADAIASGRDQRAMANPETLKKAMPYPELETVTVDDEIEDEISENEEVGVKFGEEGTEEVKEDAKPDFLDLDDDGDKKESMKKAAKDKDKVKETIERKEKLIQEDIKKMKQIIKPITKI